MRYTFHDFRRLFITDAIAHGMPPHIAQLVAGHRDINTTMGYKAVYPEEVINGHRAFIARRRALRPSRGIPHPHRRGMGRVRRPLRTPQGRRRRLRTLLRHRLHPRTQLSALPAAAPGSGRPRTGWKRSATTSSPASPKPNPTAGTARPRVSRSASPARTPNSPRWTRSPANRHGRPTRHPQLHRHRRTHHRPLKQPKSVLTQQNTNSIVKINLVRSSPLAGLA